MLDALFVPEGRSPPEPPTCPAILALWTWVFKPQLVGRSVGGGLALNAWPSWNAISVVDLSSWAERAPESRNVARKGKLLPGRQCLEKRLAFPCQDPGVIDAKPVLDGQECG